MRSTPIPRAPSLWPPKRRLHTHHPPLPTSESPNTNRRPHRRRAPFALPPIQFNNHRFNHPPALFFYNHRYRCCNSRRSHNKMLPWFTQQNSPPKEPSFYSADISVPLQSLPYYHPPAFNPTRPTFLPRRVTSGSFYPRPINNTTNLPCLSTKTNQSLPLQL